jgi:hypothetical protein
MYFQVIYEDESISDTITIGLELDICTFPTLCGRPVNSSRRKRTMCLRLGLEYANKV